MQTGRTSFLTLSLSLLSLTAYLAISQVARPDQVQITLLPEAPTQEQTTQLRSEPTTITPAAAEPEDSSEVALYWRHDTVRKGDSMSSIFKRHSINPTSLHDLINLNEDTKRLGFLKPGERLSFATDDEGDLMGLLYEKNPLHQIHITRSGRQLVARTIRNEPETRQRLISGSIDGKNSSLFLAGKEAGLSDQLIMKLASIFQWDISFALELRPGDRFELLYEDLWNKGERVGEGEVLAARFVNMGREYLALRYTNRTGKTGYFTPEGRSLSKAFLRDPVHFSRVSSHFNLRRLHPIHKRTMPHLGTDYAANPGTPVRASGDGMVTTAARNSAAGNHVILKHGQKYTTRYLHLSRFAKGIRRGRKVKQGEVIGYVGATGWATGPHLHYEFLIDGVHQNPRKVNLPRAKKVGRWEMARFTSNTAPFLARLEQTEQGGEMAALGGGGK